MFNEEDLLCPITLELLDDPVQVPCCGKTVSRAPLIIICETNRICPMCRTELPESFDPNKCVGNCTLHDIVSHHKKSKNKNKKQQQQQEETSDEQQQQTTKNPCQQQQQLPDPILMAALRAKMNEQQQQQNSDGAAAAASSSSSPSTNNNKIFITLAVSGTTTNKVIIVNRDNLSFSQLLKAAENKVGITPLRLEFQDDQDQIDLDDDDSLEMFFDIFDRSHTARHKITCVPPLHHNNNNNSLSLLQQQYRSHRFAGMIENGGKLLKESLQFRGHEAAIYGLAFAPSGKEFVTCSRDNSFLESS